jgi:TP901 family phage tail tape measure protein
MNLDVGFAVDEKGLLQVIDNAAAHWRKAFENVGGGIDTAIGKAAQSSIAANQKLVKDTEAAAKKMSDARASGIQKILELSDKARLREEQNLNKATEAVERASKRQGEAQQKNLVERIRAEENAAQLIAQSAQKYAKLRAEFEGRSLNDVREQIHKLEQETRVLRDARSDSEDAATRKHIQGQTNSVNADLQLYRSLEKEKIGRTFSEQMERLNLESKTNKEIRSLLKQQAEDFERIQHQMTVSQDVEEKKRLKQTIDELKAEQAATKQEAESRGVHTTGSINLKGGVKDGLSGAVQNLASNAAASAGPLGGVVQQLSGIGPAGLVAAGGIGAAVMGIKKAIEVGANFEDSVQELSAITGAEGKDLEGLSEKARALGVEFGGGASKGVEAFKLVVSALGPEVAKNQAAMDEMGRDVMTLAKAAGIDAPNATSVLTNTLNQFGGATLSAKEQAKEMTRIMNVMAAGAKQGAAEIPDLSEAIKIVGTVAHGSKMSVEETTAAIETMSMSGLKGGEAGTGLRNVILDLSSGTKRATSALSELGLTFDDVNPEKVGFTKSLQIMKEHLSTVTDATQRAEIMSHLFGKENIASANILIAGVDQVKQMTGAVTGTNEAHEQAEKRMNTFHAALEKLTATFEDVGISVFGTFGPALTKVLDVIQPIIVPLGIVAGVIGTIIVASKTWAIVQTALNIVLNANPIGLIVIAVAALAAGIIYLYNNVKPVHDLMDSVWTVIKKVSSAVWEGIKFWAEWLNPIGLAIKIFQNFDGILGAIQGTFKKLASFIGEFVSKEITNLAKAFGGVGDVISGVTHMNLGDIKKGIGEVASSIGGIIGLANGAVLTAPTIVGISNGTPIVAGEAGAEAVIPLDKYPGLKKLMSDNGVSPSVGGEDGGGSGQGAQTYLTQYNKLRSTLRKDEKEDVAEQKKGLEELHKASQENIKLLEKPFVNAWHNMTNSAVSGVKKVTGSMREMGGVGGGILADLLDGFIDMGVKYIEEQAAMLAESVLTTTAATATQVASMEVIKAEAVPAAAAVSVATGGVAAATGGASLIGMLAGVLGAFGMADGGFPTGFVGGSGGERDDRNWRKLSRTEFVVNGKQAPKWAPVLHAINDGAEPGMGIAAVAERSSWTRDK